MFRTQKQFDAGLARLIELSRNPSGQGAELDELCDAVEAWEARLPDIAPSPPHQMLTAALDLFGASWAELDEAGRGLYRVADLVAGRQAFTREIARRLAPLVRLRISDLLPRAASKAA